MADYGRDDSSGANFIQAAAAASTQTAAAPARIAHGPEPAPPLTPEQLAALKRYDGPTVANAIETFNARSRSSGFMRPQVRCMFPRLGAMVGYAVTARIRAAQAPISGERLVSNFDWWDFILKQPRPRVVIIQDLDAPGAIGSFWGEVQANIHRALGCLGTVTNGGVRDLQEVAPLNFHFFAQFVMVSHAYVRMFDFGGPVEIAGLTIRTGDLIHADQHGVQQVPLDLAPQVPAAAEKIFTREHRIIDYCKSHNFTVDGLKAIMEELKKETL